MKTFMQWHSHIIDEDLPGSSTPSVAGAGADGIVVKKKKKRKVFDVPSHVFKRFENNERVKYERWVKYIGAGIYEDKMLQYIKDNKNCKVTIRDQVSGETKLIKSI